MNPITATDLFCGAGGTSTGILRACAELGRSVRLLAINHWDTAIDTHTRNHPGVRHLCQSLDSIDPRSERYHYDTDAIKEPASEAMLKQVDEGYQGLGLKDYESAGVQNPSSVKARIIANARKNGGTPKVNKRTVWTVPTFGYPGAHFATYPPDLIKPCILAGCPVGGTVLDPFGGSGTTGAVALELGRKAILIELNPEYVALIRQRCDVTHGLPL